MYKKIKKAIALGLILSLGLAPMADTRQVSASKKTENKVEVVKNKDKEDIKVEKLHPEMEDFSKQEKQYIKEAQSIAATNGALAAQKVNELSKDKELFKMAVDEVLNHYYEKEKHSKKDKKILKEFTGAVDESADRLVKEYEVAEKERNQDDLDYAPGKVIVQFKKEATEEQIAATIENMKGKGHEILNDVEQHIDKHMSEEEIEQIHNMEEMQDCRIVSVEIANRQTVDLAVEEYKEYDIIELVEKDAVCEAAGEVKFTKYARNQVKSDKAWQYVMETWPVGTGRLIPRVAVLDTGLDVNNPDLKNRYSKVHSCDVTRIDPDTGDYLLMEKAVAQGIPTYYNYHGTKVASVIAAEAGNEVGMSGLGTYNGFYFDLVAIKAGYLGADDKGHMSDSDMIKGILYATAKGCNVINISFGGEDVVSSSMQKAIDTAYFQGSMIVTSTGNLGKECSSISPGSANHIIAVGSSNTNTKKADHSNYGNMIDVLAPGENLTIYTEEGIKYNGVGTSFATPIVAVEAALLYHIGLKNVDHIAHIIKSTATDIYEPGWDKLSGHGIINMYKAVQQAVSDMVVPQYENNVDKYIFDYEFYAAAYPDLANVLGYNQTALYKHWKSYGISEGRVASAAFSIGYYMEVNPDIVAAYGNNPYLAYTHFIQSGVNEGRTLSPVLNVTYYGQCHPDLSGMDAFALLRHFVEHGIYEGRSGTIEWFDVRKYAFSKDLNSILFIGPNTWKMFFCEYAMRFI